MSKTSSALTVLFVATLSVCAAGVAAAAPGADDAKTVVDAASKAMGVTGLKSITISGAAANGNFGQSRTISFGLASTSIRNYVRTIDFTVPASHATGITQPPAAVRGGPLPPMGTYEQMITAATPAWPQQMQIWTTPLWLILMGWIIHLWSIIDAARFTPPGAAPA